MNYLNLERGMQMKILLSLLLLLYGVFAYADVWNKEEAPTDFAVTLLTQSLDVTFKEENMYKLIHLQQNHLIEQKQNHEFYDKNGNLGRAEFSLRESEYKLIDISVEKSIKEKCNFYVSYNPYLGTSENVKAFGISTKYFSLNDKDFCFN